MLFKHVCTDHEEIDIEDIEDHIPAIVVKAPTSAAPAGAAGAIPAPNPGAVRRPGAAQPPGIGTRPEDAAPTKDALTGLINIDRYRIDQYPCEVCGKVYGDEGDLLKHLELKHPISPSSVERNAAQMTRNPDEVVAPAGSSKARIMSAAEAAAAAKFAVAALQKQESNRGKDVMISVKCDLCVGKQKVYTSGSALLAHLMGKHPTVNAALKIKELLAIADKTEANKCPHCDKIFSTQDAMQSHITTKHDGITNANTRTSVSAGNNWWCNECDKGFTSPQGLRGHQHSKHGFVTVPVKCPICKRMTSDNFACDEHIKLSHPTARWTSSPTFNCFECPRGFLSPEDRDVHMRKYHPVVEDSMQSINEKRFGTQKVKSVSRGTSSAPKPPGGMSFPAPPPPPSR
jgi:rubrerythrin